LMRKIIVKKIFKLPSFRYASLDKGLFAYKKKLLLTREF
jgi:hypothetical protein